MPRLGITLGLLVVVVAVAVLVTVLSARSSSGQGSPQAPGVATPIPAFPQPRTKTTGCQIRDGLPDPACTPGAVDPRVAQDTIQQTICVSGYTRTVRPSEPVTERIKREQMRAYGLEGQRLGDYELDHLVPLELGGAPEDIANLWPEPWTGEGNAHEKDAVETYLHEQVCVGRMPLLEAQRAIATDWLRVYRDHHLRPR
jgi:hypothetical protein